MSNEIYNISPVDGRYKNMTEEVAEYFSEYCLIKNRIIVEIEWLKKIFKIEQMGIKCSSEDLNVLDKIVEEFNLVQAERVKEIDSVTNHDVKAVEYYLNEKFKEYGIEKYNHLVHFECTSEDINNIAYGMMIKQLLEKVYIPNVNQLIKILTDKASEYAEIPMLSHTHGQSATPTTVGKELAIFEYRLRKYAK